MRSSSEVHPDSQVRTYDRANSIVFLKTNEPFGGLSNMAGGFPLKVNGLRISTSEALYQVCRFPHRPEVQRLIIEQASPMTAKMKSKPYRRDSRLDWDRVRVKVMRWCLRVKLAQNWAKFSELLLSTADHPIVEQSRKDDFWGAKPVDKQTLVGMNVLGRLLMELREELRASDNAALLRVEPPALPDFLLDGRPIQPVLAEGGPDICQVSRTLEWATHATEPRVPLVQAPLFNQTLQRERAELQSSELRSCHKTTNHLTRYPAYEDSCVPWLGEVPAGWEVRRNGRLFAERKETGFPDLPILEVSLKTGVRIRDFGLSERKQVMADRDKYKRAASGDIAYNMMRMWQGAVGVAPTDGLVSPAYVVARPLPGTVPRYFAYLYRISAYMGEVNNYSHGIVADRNRLYWDEFKQIPTPYPPADEQAAIVRFLDHADRRIRRYIRAKQKLIKLLEEQKQAVIRRAVTRGMDPNGRLKPSGVEWLSDVPEHWEISRVKNEFRCLNPRRIPLSGTERGAMTLRRYDYYGASGVIDKVDDYLFDEELLLIAEDGANLVLRNLPLAIIARGKFWVNNHAHILKPTRGNLEFLATLMETLNYKPWISGAAQPKLTQDRLMGVAIAVPPPDEQECLMNRVQDETAPVRTAIDRARREINLLREYRTRLIADVVTGKLDVREAAANLPAETEESELPLATGELDEEVDVESSDGDADADE